MEERVPAPELDGGTEWLNADRPVALADLRGRVVVLHFFTSARISCLHSTAALAAARARFRGRPLTVIGVWSARFPSEKRPDHLRATLQRLRVSHPVIVDADLHLARRYQIPSWPTLIILGPDGTIAHAAPGEPDPEKFFPLL